MNIDEHDFDLTSKAVFLMNPSAPTLYDTPDDLKSFMISMSYQYMHETHSFSTGGFCLTAYDSPSGERIVRASVMSYVATQFLKTQGLL